MAICLRCGNEWTPRKEHPKRCPACQNPNWNRELKRKRAKIEETPTPIRHSPEAEVANGDVVQHAGIVEESVAAPPHLNDTLSDMKSRAEALLRQLA